MANGGIIGVMSRGSLEENTAKWMCPGGKMTSTSSSPFFSQSDKMSPSKLCNLIVSLPLHHCPQTHSPFQPLFSPSPLPAFPLNHCNTAFPHFILLKTSCFLLPRNIYECGHKGHGWPKQLFRDLIFHVSPHNLTHKGREERHRDMDKEKNHSQ